MTALHTLLKPSRCALAVLLLLPAVAQAAPEAPVAKQPPAKAAAPAAATKAAPKAAAATAAKPAPQAPIKLSVTYDVDVSVDPNRGGSGLAVSKALLGKVSHGGAVSFGSLQDTVLIEPTTYSVSSTGQAADGFKPFLPGDKLSRQSEGMVVGGRLASQRFSETRGSKPTRRVEFDYAKRVAIFYKGKTVAKQEPLLYSTADVASLPYMFVKQPMPRAPLTVALTDGKSIRNLALKPEETSVQIGGQNIPAVKLTRVPESGDDAAVDLWLRKSDGMPLRLRLDLNTKYGLVLNQQVREVPAPLK